MRAHMIMSNLQELTQELFLIPESVNLVGLTKECHNLPEEDLALMYQKLHKHRDSEYLQFTYPDVYANLEGLSFKRIYEFIVGYYREFYNSLESRDAFKIFLSKGKRIEINSKELKVNDFLRSEIIICGSRVESSTKIKCVEFMQDMGIPLYTHCIRVLLKRYMSTGNFYIIDLRKEV